MDASQKPFGSFSRLAQSVERQPCKLGAAGSSPKVGAYVFGPFRTWRDVQREDACQKIRISLSVSKAFIRFSQASHKSTSHSFFRKRFSMRVSEAPHELRVRLSLAVFHRKSPMNIAGTDFSINLSYAMHALLGNLS